MTHEFSNLEEEYTPRYCQQLEVAYGKGMMSEGGVEGIEEMFDQIPIEGKKALDIGSGLGGVAFYLSEKYGMDITCLEVNRWMVAESVKRSPSALKKHVRFLLSTSNTKWPLADESYDLIYSKGVLTHVEAKGGMFQECHRLLKKGGLFVITDWLSNDGKEWGENIQKLIGMGNLVLYPESESGYTALFERQGFKMVSVRDESPSYMRFNREIIERLEHESPSAIFSKEELAAHIGAYKLILDALKEQELRVVRFIAQKA